MKAQAIVTVLLLLLVTGTASAQDEAQQVALEYMKMMKSLQAQARSLGADEELELLESNLLPFIEKYPTSPEAAKAHFNLGQFYAQGGSHPDKAIAHLKAYFEIDSIKMPRNEINAKYMMASAYIAKESFEDAETALRGIAENASYDDKTKQMAIAELGRLPILRKLRIGMPAMPFSTEATDGKPISTEGLKGKIVLLDFWASWCGPCKREMPNVMKVYNEFHDKGFEIVGISLDNDRNSFEAYVREQMMPWRQIYDGKGWQAEIGQMYGVGSIPATYLLDRQGKIRYKNLRGPELRRAVGELISER
jgi:peroxiredoxin